MSQISKIKLPKTVEDGLIHNLPYVFSSLHSNDEMKLFFTTLLTPTEQLMLAKRLCLIILLEEGLPDTRIADMLHVTRITVAKTRYYYESRGQGYKIALEKLKEKDQLDSLKNLLLSLARYTVKAAGGRV